MCVVFDEVLRLSSQYVGIHNGASGIGTSGNDILLM